MMAEGLDGLETNHRSFTAEQREAMAGVARALGLVATGGADYHRAPGPSPPGPPAPREAHPPPPGLPGAPRPRGPPGPAWPSATPASRCPTSSSRACARPSARGAGRLVLDEGRVELDGLALVAPPGPVVERLDEHREPHRRVDVGLLDVDAEPVGEQRDADE